MISVNKKWVKMFIFYLWIDSVRDIIRICIKIRNKRGRFYEIQKISVYADCCNDGACFIWCIGGRNNGNCAKRRI